MKNSFYLILVVFVLISCAERKLPFLGEKELDGSPYKVPTFEFVNQDSQKVNNSTFEGKVYIVDFFFTKCPTICPKVKANVLDIYKTFEGNEHFKIISHSIDTKNDTIPALKKYASKIGIENANQWHFVTGKKMELYEMGDHYFIAAMESEDAPGGFDHSGKVVLVDQNGHIRSFFEGTDANEVPRFIKDIKSLLNEK